MSSGNTCGPWIPVKEVYTATVLYVCGLHGPPVQNLWLRWNIGNELNIICFSKSLPKLDWVLQQIRICIVFHAKEAWLQYLLGPFCRSLLNKIEFAMKNDFCLLRKQDNDRFALLRKICVKMIRYGRYITLVTLYIDNWVLIWKYVMQKKINQR